MRLIVGLGNPGTKYSNTRHNAGFLVLSALAKDLGVEFKKCPVSEALSVRVKIGQEPCVLSMPMTYMNMSGVAVKAQAMKFDASLDDILVIYDDMALGFGRLRLRAAGSAGGHNGIKSIIEHLGSNQFPRLRLGVGRPREQVDAADYVLSNFTPAERKLLPDFINQSLTCVHSWVTKGTEKAMNEFNGSAVSPEK